MEKGEEFSENTSQMQIWSPSSIKKRIGALEVSRCNCMNFREGKHWHTRKWDFIKDKGQRNWRSY